MAVSSRGKNAKPSDSSRYAMLAIDDLKLLIPQEQIKSLEMSTDMDSSKSSDTVAGYLEFENRPWPVFCFSAGLAILTPTPSSRRVCILLQAESGSFGILCDHAELLDDGEIDPQPLSECMATTDSPLLSLTIFDDEVSSISSAELLSKLLPVKQANKNTGVVDYV